MSNDFFNHTSRLSRHTLGRAENVNAILDAVAAGFEKLPAEARINRGRVTFAVDSGAANALVVSMPKTMTAYENGSTIWVEVAETNTGSATINVDGLGARAIRMPDGGAISAGDLTAGDIVQLVYDTSAVAWVLTSPYRLLTLINNLRDVVIGSYANDVEADASGFAIAEGTFYFKTTTPKGLRLYRDGGWVDAVLDASGALLVANNLSDVANAETARFNLGVFEVRTPSNVTPADAATVSTSGLTLTGSAYYSLYGKTKAAAQWQVSTASDFSTTVVNTGDVAGTGVTYTVAVQTLSVSTTYYWRCRYKDSDGEYSLWSTGTSFTTASVFTPSAEVAKIVAGDADAGDLFGTSVDVSGNYAIVGAPSEDGASSNEGAVYFYLRDGAGSWSQVQKLQSSDIQNGDDFGRAVAIDGNYAVVGAPQEDTGGTAAGAVYVFELSGGTWSQMQKIQSSDIAAGDQIGTSVAIDGTTLVFGTIQDASQAGAAYVFDLSGGTWTQTAKLTASDAQSGDNFGYSVAISGNYILVSAPLEDTTISDAGSCYFFELSGSWLQVAKVQASDAAISNPSKAEFGGGGVSIDGDFAVIGGAVAGQVYIFERDGTWAETEIITIAGIESVALSGSTLIVGAPDYDDAVINAGGVFIYKHDGAGSWDLTSTITASDAEANDGLGNSVAVSGIYAIAGATLEDAGGTSAGAAYIFE